tara:strand:- start:130 stop:540 length:411 start_codon:yes stop_codon:yes gene_type:complete
VERETESKIYNDLGTAVIKQIGTIETKILIYIVLVDSNIDYSIFYLDRKKHLLDRNKHRLRSLAGGNDVALALLQLKAYVESLPAEHRWTAMEYWLDRGKVDISLSYDEIDEEVPQWQRSPAIVENYFPGIPVERD